MNLEPGVLDDVLGVLGVTHQTVDDAEEVAAVQIDERTKGVDVAVARSGDYRRVTLGHAYRLDGGRTSRLGVSNPQVQSATFCTARLSRNAISLDSAQSRLAQVLLVA